jgi:hypothetical protein
VRLVLDVLGVWQWLKRHQRFQSGDIAEPAESRDDAVGDAGGY